MKTQPTFPLDPEMRDCLHTLSSFAQSNDLDPELIALRASQFAECARGRLPPEVAFDPTAIRVRALASRVAAASTRAYDDWLRSVSRALAAA